MSDLPVMSSIYIFYCNFGLLVEHTSGSHFGSNVILNSKLHITLESELLLLLLLLLLFGLIVFSVY